MFCAKHKIRAKVRIFRELSEKCAKKAVETIPIFKTRQKRFSQIKAVEPQE